MPLSDDRLCCLGFAVSVRLQPACLERRIGDAGLLRPVLETHVDKVPAVLLIRSDDLSFNTAVHNPFLSNVQILIETVRNDRAVKEIPVYYALTGPAVLKLNVDVDDRTEPCDLRFQPAVHGPLLPYMVHTAGLSAERAFGISGVHECSYEPAFKDCAARPVYEVCVFPVREPLHFQVFPESWLHPESHPLFPALFPAFSAYEVFTAGS